MKSPYEMWHGEKPPPTLLQWFQPCFFKVQRKHKTDAQAKPGFYLGPALNHPCDTHRMLSQETGQLRITRDVTWRHVPTPAPLSAQQTLPAPVEGGEDDEIAVEGREGTSIPGGGGDNASDSDEDLEVIWEEVEPPETAGDAGAAAGGEPGTTESTGTSFRGGRLSPISFHGYI